jgi:pyruvate dehydrogenase E1 component alpha subunit
VEEYKGKDPIEQVLKTIRENKLLPKKEIEAINEDVKAEVEDSVTFAEESPYPIRLNCLKTFMCSKITPTLLNNAE